MKKEKKTVKAVNYFEYTDMTALEEYLRIEEKNGFRITDIEKDEITFEKCEPNEAWYYAVLHMRTDSMVGMDVGFISDCEKRTNWKYVTFHRDGLYVFRSETPEEKNIIADKEENLSVIFKKSARRIIKEYSGFLVLILWFAFHLVLTKNKYISPLSDSFFFYAVFAAVFLVGQLSFRFAKLFSWRNKAKKNLLSNKEICYSSLPQANRRNNLSDIVASICFVLFYVLDFLIDPYSKNIVLYILIIAVFLLLAVISLIISGKQPKFNRVIKITDVFWVVFLVLYLAIPLFSSMQPRQYDRNGRIIFNDTSMPVSMVDFGFEEDNTENNAYGQGTIFCKQYTYYSSSGWQENEPAGDFNSLHYTVFESKYQKSKENFFKGLQKEKDENGNVELKENENTYSDICKVCYNLVNTERNGNVGFVADFGDVVVVCYSSEVSAEKFIPVFADVMYDR